MAKTEAVTGKKKVERVPFPDTFNVEYGSRNVFLALELRENVETKYGESDVLTVVNRLEPQKTYSLFWPYKLKTRPALQTPFLLVRGKLKGEWSCTQPANAAEMSELWQTGRLESEGDAGDAPEAAAPAPVNKAAELVAKFSAPLKSVKARK